MQAGMPIIVAAAATGSAVHEVRSAPGKKEGSICHTGPTGGPCSLQAATLDYDNNHGNATQHLRASLAGGFIRPYLPLFATGSLAGWSGAAVGRGNEWARGGRHAAGHLQEDVAASVSRALLPRIRGSSTWEAAHQALLWYN